MVLVINEMLEMPVVDRLRKDLRAAATTLSDDEARFLVDAYYTMQKARIAAGGQVRALNESEEPHAVLAWLKDQNEVLENQVKAALDRYSAAHPLGRWARSIVGVGPVIAAGLLAHIDFDRVRTAGDIWRFAGLDPSVTWEKGQKRPWNADLKVLCWKLGESFVKTHNHPQSFYGPIYAARKELELARNEAGAFAETARQRLEQGRIKDAATRAVYEAGKLPLGRLELRARRVAVKLFLSHFAEVGYELHHGQPFPAPYAMVFAGHAHKIPPPNWPMAEE